MAEVDWMWCSENPKESAAEIERLLAALTQIASVANHGVNSPVEALALISDLVRIHQQSTNKDG